MATEIVCGTCGARNGPGEDFCGQCGTYLEWDDAADREIPAKPATSRDTERREHEGKHQHPGTPATDAAIEQEAPKTLGERMKAVVGTTAAERGTVSAGHQAVEPPSTLEADADAGDASVGAVLPGMARPKPRKRAAEAFEQPLQHGDLVCGHCGAGNQPTRRFCRRCGQDLAEAEVARIPWWRRILLRRKTRAQAAGSRPRVARRGRRLRSFFTLAAILITLAGGVLLTRPYWDTARNGVEDRLRNVEPATPDEVRASSSASGHPAPLVRDNGSRSYWAPSATKRAVGQYLEMRFDRPVRLVYVLVSNGVSGDGNAYLRNGRATRLRATLFTATGTRMPAKTLRLMDTAEPQQRSLRGSDVVRVRFTIAGRKRGAPGTLVGIREIELFKRR